MLIDDVNTSRASGLTDSIAAIMFCVPPTLTLNVRSRSRSLLGGRMAARCRMASTPSTAERTPSASVMSPRTIFYPIPVFQPRKVHHGKVEHAHRATRPDKHVDKLPPDAARGPR